MKMAPAQGITPDRWVILDYVDDKGAKKSGLLTGNFGSYLNGMDWRTSSFIVKIEDMGDYYFVDTVSGSSYKLYKASVGLSSLMSDILANLEAAAAKIRYSVSVRNIGVDGISNIGE